jgi:hypothetical protein
MNIEDFKGASEIDIYLAYTVRAEEGMIYRDHRGLRITDDDMLDKFQESGKSEQDWEAFFGKELWQLNGFAYSILDSYIIGRDWAIEVNARKDKNHEPR